MRASDGTIGFIPLPQNLERKQTLLSLDGFYDDARRKAGHINSACS